MEWTRSETIGLASASCVFCRGLGLRKTPTRGETKPCGCVFREIFRACHGRYRHCIEKSGLTSQVAFEITTGSSGYRFYGRRNEEFIADFEITSRRSLSEEEFGVFHFHHQLGADWKQTSTKLGMSKGNFFHLKYQIEEKLGRVYRELQPHCLFPLDQYFGGVALKKITARQQIKARSVEMIDGKTVVAMTNLLEMPRRTDKISCRFPLRDFTDKAA